MCRLIGRKYHRGLRPKGWQNGSAKNNDLKPRRRPQNSKRPLRRKIHKPLRPATPKTKGEAFISNWRISKGYRVGGFWGEFQICGEKGLIAG